MLGTYYYYGDKARNILIVSSMPIVFVCRAGNSYSGNFNFHLKLQFHGIYSTLKRRSVFFFVYFLIYYLFFIVWCDFNHCEFFMYYVFLVYIWIFWTYCRCLILAGPEKNIRYIETIAEWKFRLFIKLTDYHKPALHCY